MAPVPFSRHFWLAIAGGAVFFTAVLVRLPLLHNAFSVDDFHLIVTNRFIADPRNAAALCEPRLFRAPLAVRCGARPVTVLSLMADRGVWGLHPFGYHLTNILLHAIASVLVWVCAFLLYARCGLPDGPRRWFFSLCAAAVFSFHPAQTEAVAVASFRGDLLAAVCTLLAVAVVLWRGATAPALIAAVLSMAGGLLAKESALAAPFLVLGVLVLVRRDKPLSVLSLLFMIGFVGSLLVLYGQFFWGPRVRYPFVGGVFPAIVGVPSPVASVAAYLNTLVVAWLHAWQTVLVPVRLSVEYQVVAGPGLLWTKMMIAGVLAFAVLLLLRVRAWALTAGIFWAFISYVPVSNLIPLMNTVADRYLYLPMVGFAIVIAYVFQYFFVFRPRSALLGGAVLVGLGMAASMHRQPVFRNNATIYAEAIRRAPDNPRARFNHVIARMVQDDYSGALALLRRIERDTPLYRPAEVWGLMADCLRELGDRSGAEHYYGKALLVAPLTS